MEQRSGQKLMHRRQTCAVSDYSDCGVNNSSRPAALMPNVAADDRMLVERGGTCRRLDTPTSSKSSSVADHNSTIIAPSLSKPINSLRNFSLYFDPQQGYEVLRVCMSVCLFCRISEKNHISKVHEVFCTHVNLGRGLVLLWWQCSYFMYSGFVNDVMFLHNGADGPESKTTQCFVGFVMWRHQSASSPSVRGVKFAIPACLITSPAGVVAKYCNEHVSVCLCVCVCVCLSASLSREPNTQSSPNFYACCLLSWLGPLPARWRNPKGRGQFLGFYSLLTMHCIGHIAVWISLRRIDLA